MTLYQDLPPNVVVHILSFFSFPDLEFHPLIASKLDSKRIAISTTNQFLFRLKHLISYYYGYFRNDKTRSIVLLNQSLKIISNGDHESRPNSNIPKNPPFSNLIPNFGLLKKLTLFRITLQASDIAYLPKSLTYVSVMTASKLDVSVFEEMLSKLPLLNSIQFQAKLEDKNNQLQKIFHKMCRLKSVSILSTSLKDHEASIFLNPKSNNNNNEIEQLSLVNCELTHECLTVLAENRTLKCLRISRNEISDEGCKEIAKCHSLLELSIDACNITGDGVEYVSKLPEIRRLWIRQNSVSLMDIQISPHLQILNFHDNHGQISVQMCKAMAQCTSIHTLVMNKCRLTDDHINALLDGNITLRRLYINWNDNLSIRSIEEIAKNKSIYKLAYSQRTLTDTHLKHLLENNNVIQVLNIPYSPRVTNEFLPSLARSKSLRTLKIRQVENITSDGIEFIKQMCLSVTQMFYGGEEQEEHWIRPGTDPSLLAE